MEQIRPCRIIQPQSGRSYVDTLNDKLTFIEMGKQSMGVSFSVVNKMSRI